MGIYIYIYIYIARKKFWEWGWVPTGKGWWPQAGHESCEWGVSRACPWNPACSSQFHDQRIPLLPNKRYQFHISLWFRTASYCDQNPASGSSQAPIYYHCFSRLTTFSAPVWTPPLLPSGIWRWCWARRACRRADCRESAASWLCIWSHSDLRRETWPLLASFTSLFRGFVWHATTQMFWMRWFVCQVNGGWIGWRKMRNFNGLQEMPYHLLLRPPLHSCDDTNNFCVNVQPTQHIAKIFFFNLLLLLFNFFISQYYVKIYSRNWNKFENKTKS